MTIIKYALNSSSVLIVMSHIDPCVAEARGYRHIGDKDKAGPAGVRILFGPNSDHQGCLCPFIRCTTARESSSTSSDRRNRELDENEKPIKYETPVGQKMRLDIHPFMRDRLNDATAPLWLTEGARKADAAVSIDLCCVALLGVWSWRGTRSDGMKGPLEDWDAIELDGREVYIAYDSDVMRNPSVQHAAPWISNCLPGYERVR